jgi:hypothetical protein
VNACMRGHLVGFFRRRSTEDLPEALVTATAAERAKRLLSPYIRALHIKTAERHKWARSCDWKEKMKLAADTTKVYSMQSLQLHTECWGPKVALGYCEAA